MSANPPHHHTRELPPHPSLEQLRKQAKELLEHYRSGDPTVVAEIHTIERNPDPSTFKLADAQRVLARSYGFESWAKLRAFVDRANVTNLIEAVTRSDLAQVRALLHARPELINMDRNANDEHRALHYAVLRRDLPMVCLLLEAGADPRKGIFPHRDATSAFAIAQDREYHEVVAAIEQEEQARRSEMSCPNATVSPQQDQISAAIVAHDNPTAIRLLEANKSLIHACDREGATPLHIAAQEANLEMLIWLLEHRAPIRKPDVHGLTALDRATLSADPRNGSAQQFPSIARRLLQSGAEMTIRAAVALGEGLRVRELITADPDVLRQVHWRTGGLLSLAVNHGQLEMVRLLLDLGADVDERVTLEELEEPTLSWSTPLWYAALAGQREIAELLLDRGADPNANVYASGWPLRNAWNAKHESVKRLLLDHGAKPQPYMVAEAHDLAEARRLLDSDPSEDLAYELVWSAADHGCPEIVDFALARLTFANGDPKWHWVLIQPIRGAPGDASDCEGHFQSLERLLTRGIDPNVSRFGQTPLHYAAARGGALRDAARVRFASILLDHGARLDLRDDLLESTPLAWACRWGRTELVKLLVDRGAPVRESAAEPWATPEAWARKSKQDAVLAILQKH